MNTDDKNDDLSLFRAAMSDVKPLNAEERAAVETSPPPPRPLQKFRDEQNVMAELLDYDPSAPQAETGDDLRYLMPGLQKGIMRRLRRGQYSVRDSIDLHHMNEDTARQVLIDFIAHACRNQFACVRIIHGKGLRSKDLPRLKILVASLLRRHPNVVAFASCRPVDGGTGACDVLLRERQAVKR